MKILTVIRAKEGGLAVVPLRMPTTRKCGNCRACCWRYPIFELDAKPKQQACEHECRAGCAIQESKPKECGRYACFWLKGFGIYGDRPDKLGAIFDLPDIAHEIALTVRVSRTPGPIRIGRVTAIASILESYGNLLAFDTDNELEFDGLFQSVLSIEPGQRVLARMTTLHRAWRLSAEAMLAGVDLKELPPQLTPEVWAQAKAERSDAELLDYARHHEGRNP